MWVCCENEFLLDYVALESSFSLDYGFHFHVLEWIDNDAKGFDQSKQLQQKERNEEQAWEKLWW